MSGSWKEMSLEYKRKQQADPQEPRVRKGRFVGERPKGKKQRMDALEQAAKEFFEELERDETFRASAFNCKWKEQGHKQGPWECWHGMSRGWLDSAWKKFLKAVKACADAGDPLPPSWLGMSR